MNTLIPRQTKLSRERIEVRLETGLIAKLDRYCEYLESDRDYVVTQLLEFAFRKDRGFSEWLDSKPAVPEQSAPPRRRANGSVGVAAQ